MKWEVDVPLPPNQGRPAEPEPVATIIHEHDGVREIVAQVYSSDMVKLIQRAPDLRNELRLAIAALEAMKTGAAMLPDMRRLLKECE